MPKHGWIIGACVLVLLCLAGITMDVIGVPVSESKSKTEAQMKKTSWTHFTKLRHQPREKIHDRCEMIFLQLSEKLRDLSSSAKIEVPEMNKSEQLERMMNNSRIVRDTVKVKYENNSSPSVEKAAKLRVSRETLIKADVSGATRVSCAACKIGAGVVQRYIKVGKSNEEIMNRIYRVCVTLRIQTPRVCRGVTKLFTAEMIHVLKHINMSASQICGYIVDDDCDSTNSSQADWNVTLPLINKPPVKPLVPPIEGAPTLKVLHISDFHYDPYYQEGSNALCKEPLCCRLTNGPPATVTAAAGRWGDYRNCDTPKRTIDHMLGHIAETHRDIDYILWTGDLPAHDIWNQTAVDNLKIIREMVSLLILTFPGVPIFPALGNHETVPVNSFPPPYAPKEFSISWLYEELDRQWKKWLPAVSLTIRRGAFYSILVRLGFRIISLNMNYCNNQNWWLLINTTDPVGELHWLIDELQAAEINKEKVHIIGHIPPGHSDCLRVWSRNYYEIVNRYESTITAQFFGHTHYDEFQLFYDTSNLERAISVAYIGPSVTPFYDLNPGYRIYHIDGDHNMTTRLVVDHESWMMNLNEANTYDRPLWKKLYSARRAYKMSSLLPSDWNSLIGKISNEPEIFDLYYKHYYKNSSVRPACNDKCRKRLVCDLRSGKSHDRKNLCRNLV